MPTNYQIYVFMATLFFGMVFGLVYQIKVILENFIGDKILHFVLDFVFAVLGGVIFWLDVYLSNLGIFRIFLLITYILGFYLINFCAYSEIAKFSKMLYNCMYEKIDKNKNI